MVGLVLGDETRKKPDPLVFEFSVHNLVFLSLSAVSSDFGVQNIRADYAYRKIV